MSLGEYSFFNYCKSKQAIAELKKTEKNYEKHIEEAKEDLRQLDQNKHNLERFAREKYLMHKEKEDIFIINEE
jgi:cell division protein FtsB